MPDQLPDWPGDVHEEEVEPEPDEGEAKRDSQARIVQHRAERYVELSKQPDFQMFMREVEGKLEKIERAFTDLVKSAIHQGEKLEALEPRLYALRGLSEGLGYPRTVLATAEAHLERIDRDAEAEDESEPDDPGGF